MSSVMNERYHLIVEKLAVAFAYMKVESGKIGYQPKLLFSDANAAFSELTGYHKEAILGSAVDEMLPELARFCCDNLDKINAGDTVCLEFYIPQRDSWYATYLYSIEANYVAAVFNDITMFKKKEARMRYLSFHDQLTGLYNRHYLEIEMQRLDTERQLPLSVILTDLNSLKMVNDTYGHDYGDELLVKVADLLKSTCRSEDIICRWGGDEFIILLPKTDEEEVKRICERIKKNSSDMSIKDLPVSMAIGFSIKQVPELSLQRTIQDAERRMYKDKLEKCRIEQEKMLGQLFQSLKGKSFLTDDKVVFVNKLAGQLGNEIGLPSYELKRLKNLMILLDIGKINIMEEILAKRGPLSVEEWDNIKKHPETGYRILKTTEEFSNIADAMLAHHERWDGNGYPWGLKGEDIPLLARLAAIINAYDAMISGRPYKEAITHDQALAELVNNAGAQFDPCLVETFIKSFNLDAEMNIAANRSYGCS